MIEQIQKEHIQALGSCSPPRGAQLWLGSPGLTAAPRPAPLQARGPWSWCAPRHGPGTARIYGAWLQPVTPMEILLPYGDTSHAPAEERAGGMHFSGSDELHCSCDFGGGR